MALVLIKEDGTGKADANSYADVADGEAYHEGHLYATAWTGATADQKAAALVMATRLIDSQFQFNGSRTSASQALQWPRAECRDPDQRSAGWGVRNAECVEADVVPGAVVQATCEMARELLIVDRTAAAPGEGVDTVAVGESTNAGGGGASSSSSSSTKYSKSDTRRIISHVARAMLGRFGAPVSGGSGVVRLVRA